MDAISERNSLNKSRRRRRRSPASALLGDMGPKRISLNRLAWACILFVAATMLLSFLVGAYLLTTTAPVSVWAIILIGTSGSALAALTSTLDRYANGFQSEWGHSHPTTVTDANRERFNRRMAAWLFVRPTLGAVVAPVFVWGSDLLPPDLSIPKERPETLGFIAFMAGLLAKAVLEALKKLFDRMFATSRSG